MSTTISPQLSKLIKKRATIKSSIEVIRIYVNKFNKSTQSIRQLQIRLKSLTQYMSEFNDVQQCICNLDQGEEEEPERLEFEDMNMTLVANIEDIIAECNAATVQNISHSSSTSGGETVRITALVQRFINNCKLSHLNKLDGRTVGLLTITEIADAERFWVTNAQINAFEDELSSLKAGKLIEVERHNYKLNIKSEVTAYVL
ncbi:hypothetical protein ACI65C_013460 [Semiaphis heraclei]